MIIKLIRAMVLCNAILYCSLENLMSPAAEQDMKTGRMKEKEGKNAPGPERKSIRMQRNVHPISSPCQGL